MTMNEVNAVAKLFGLQVRKNKRGDYWIRNIGEKKWIPVISKFKTYTNADICEAICSEPEYYKS
jgi:hypothetical protein